MNDAIFATTIFSTDVASEVRAAGERYPCRDREVDEVVASWRSSVLLVGPPGVGKTAVLKEAALRLDDELGVRVYRLATSELLRGTRYLGEWETRLADILARAEEENAVLALTDIWNLIDAGKTAQSGRSLFDAIAPKLEQRQVTLFGEITPDRWSALETRSSFLRHFRRIDVRPLGAAEVDQVLEVRSHASGLALSADARRALRELPARFLPNRLPPGPALELLEVLSSRRPRDADPTDRDAVERAFSERHGLPEAIVRADAPLSLPEVRAWFSERIVGQPQAVDAVLEAITLFKAGLHDPRRPLGTFLFVGPTGVGKTETARALARWIFGSEARMLRFDLSELKDFHAFAQLVGDPHAPAQPARLLDPVRAQGFQVVLFDELEKAHPNVWDLLLPLLDEGRLTSPQGDTVDFRSTIVICTSNVGARQGASRDVGFGAKPPGDLDVEKMRRALEEHFRPELLNRFQHIVLFGALSAQQLRTVARAELARVVEREGIARRGLVVDVDDEVLDFVVSHGVDRRFGARSLQREIQRHIALPIATELVSRPATPGTLLRVRVKDDAIRVARVATGAGTETSRIAERVPEPARVRSVGELEARLAAIPSPRRTLAEVETEIKELEAAREAPDFWRDTAGAAQNEGALVEARRALQQLRRLEHEHNAVRNAIGRARTRELLDEAARMLREHEAMVAEIRRELGPLANEAARADALVEIRALGPQGSVARDLLVETYTAWASHRELELVWLRDPEHDEDPAVFLVRGRNAHGFLGGEAGLHRVRLTDEEGERARVAVARVRTAPLLDEPPSSTPRVTLKGIRDRRGRFSGDLRSSGELALEGGSTPLPLASPLRAEPLRKLAAELAAAWSRVAPPSDHVVRRYDLEPPFVRDLLTGWSSGRTDALAPIGFDRLLCARVDATLQG